MELIARIKRRATKAENRVLSRKKHLLPRRKFIFAWVGGLAQVYAAAKPRAKMRIAHSKDASHLEVLAAREICRYVYLRTGTLLRIEPVLDLPREFRGFVVSRKDRPILESLLDDSRLKTEIKGLQPQQYLLKRNTSKRRDFVLVTGGDSVGTLYGAYRLAEHYDVRFYLHGDVMPDRQVSLDLPQVNEIRKPLFELRGVNPWGSHAEGLDLWNVNDYKAILSQLVKMQMNFIGIHGYPEAMVENAPHGAEPTVWIGLPGDFDKQGRVTFSYPSSYFNTMRRGWWGYQEARKTSEYCYGASLLFERDCWGSDIMIGYGPQPTTLEGCNEVFNRTAAMFRSAFEFARFLNIRTCLGTETPLVIPERVIEKLRSQGRDRADPRVVQEVYEGTFSRLARAHPLDYYWFWTPEQWTWSGVVDKNVTQTIDDIQLGIRAIRNVRAPFNLATAGWVLGPPQKTTLLSEVLPKDIAVSALSRNVGKWPIEPAFAQISGRGKWAIPWLEDDGALTSPQLWVGRVRKDAADAHAYACTGLMGLHWRTRILGPNISALAQAAWDQSAWAPPTHTLLQPKEGPEGGWKRSLPAPKNADIQQGTVYRTYRLGMESYHLKVPNGTYQVILKFLEPLYNKPRQRVFDVKIQKALRIAKLDLAERAGRGVPHDQVVDQVNVSDGWLVIEFVPHVSLPVISAIGVENGSYTEKVNCGGPDYRDYRADWPEPGEDPDRFLPSGDFYDDWARIEFGPEVARRAAAIFKLVDCHLPVTSMWIHGAGDIAPDKRSWQEVAGEFGFVDSLEQLRSEVRGAGHRERFHYWVTTFRYMRAQARVSCLLGEFDRSMKHVRDGKDQKIRAKLARQEALPVYRELLNELGEVMTYLLSIVSTKGCLGTIINWQQKIWPVLVEKTGQELAAEMGSNLPHDIQPPKEYQGEPRVIIPTLGSIVQAGEEMPIKVIFLGSHMPRQFTLYYRPMACGRFTPLPLTHVARGVYCAKIPALPKGAIALEYYVLAETHAGRKLAFPATAPAINQTVVENPTSAITASNRNC